MRRSLILDTTVRLVFDSVVVLSLYLLFAGHNQPGGGFVGGLVVGAAIALRYVAGGLPEVRGILPIRPWFFLATGLALAAGTAIAPLLLGQRLLDHAKLEVEVPVLGTMKATSALVFDAGVYLVVVGLVLMVFEALGDDAPKPAVSDVKDLER
jgi:multicomponent Na+:H+ antiporter subunit A